MSYKLLVLDLDGTLTNSKKQISGPTLEALLAIQQKGIKVVLASGRPTFGVLPLAETLQLAHFGSYILPFNGARIIDCRTGTAIYNRILPAEITPSLFEMVTTYDADILGYSDTVLFSGGKRNEYSERESRINHMPIVETTNFLQDIDDPNYKFLITAAPEVILEIQEKAKAKYRSFLNIYRSEPYFLEIMPPRIDKAHALQKLVSSLGMTASEMICCGDGHNDVTMIEYAGLGVAMANAQPVVRTRADYITKSNDDDGVLHVIKEFLL